MISVNNTYTAADFCLQCVNSLDVHPVAPNKIKGSNGLLDKLDMARGMWDMVDCTFEGKKVAGGSDNNYPKVTLRYTEPVCDAAGADDCTDTVCSEGSATTSTDKYLSMVVDDCVTEKIEITIDEFDELCESPKERWAEYLMRKHIQMRRRKSKKILTSIYGVLSDYPSGAASTGLTTEEIPVINTDGTINNSGFAKMYSSYRAVNWEADDVTIIGGNTMASYYDIAKLKAGGSIDRDEKLNLNFAYESQLDSVFQALEADSASHGLSFPTGAFGVIDAQENTGYRRFNLPHYIADTINIGGTVYDMWVRFVECASPHWTILLKNRFTLASIPDTAYCDGGMNWHWKFACGDWTCDMLTAA